MKNIFILFFSLNSLAQVIDTQKYLHPSLSEGQCYSLADSKVYLKDVKSGRSNPELEAALGKENLTSMNNTDKESYFFCKMKCLINSETKFLWNIQKDKNENFKKFL